MMSPLISVFWPHLPTLVSYLYKITLFSKSPFDGPTYLTLLGDVLYEWSLMFIVALMQIKKKLQIQQLWIFFEAFLFLCRFHEIFLSIIRLMPFPSTLYRSQNVFCRLRIFWARPKFELLQNIFCLLKNWIYQKQNIFWSEAQKDWDCHNLQKKIDLSQNI